MIQCPTCTGLNNENAKFCRHCGSPIHDASYSTTKLPLGTVLDERYKIIDYVAKGGMGAVYKAADLQVSGIWAVKEMLDYFDSEEEREYAVERFATEAQILYDLDHPSIPKFMDCFLSDNRYYLVMEFIEGEDLRQKLDNALDARKPGIDEELAVHWATQICNVLEYLHSQDPPIIYRDLKPGNIIVTADNRVYLIDFGIARIFDPRVKGTMVGTQGYAPPEQYRGEAEPRSDLYSLAACMHHLITGKDPRNDIPFNFPPIRTIRPELNEKLEKVLAKALSMDPNDRFSNAGEMRIQLEAIFGKGLSKESPRVEIPAPVFEEPARISYWYMFRGDRRHSAKSPFGRNIGGRYKWGAHLKGEVRSSPVIAGDGTIYVGSGDGKLYALDSDGNSLWSFPTNARIVSTPAISGSRVIFGSNDCYLYCLQTNGKLLWKFRTYGRIRSSPSVGVDGVIYVGSYDHYLYALEPDGHLRWKMDLGGYVEACPAISEDGNIYTGCRGVENYLFCIDSSGNTKWYLETEGAIHASPSIARDGTIYTATDQGFLYAIDSQGTILWIFDAGSPILSSPVAYNGSSVVFGCYDTNIYSLSQQGEIKWKFKTRSMVASSPAIGADNSIFIGGDDYYLYSLQGDGQLNWKLKCNNRIRSSPSLGEGDLLYVGCDDGCLYAVE